MSIIIELYNAGEGITSEVLENVDHWHIDELFIVFEIGDTTLYHQKEQVLSMEIN
nr:MAG TPA: hypothetical protein [Caudoviricetes sp.]